MKILLVHPGPPLSQHDVWQGWGKALRELGCDVTGYRTDHFLLKYKVWPPSDFAAKRVQGEIFLAARTRRPDVVFFVGTSFIEPPLLADIEAARIPVVILHTESPYEDTRQLELAPYARVNLVNDPMNLDLYKEAGPALYVPHSYDPQVHYPGNGAKDIDFTFIGSALPSRVEFFTAMGLDGIDACVDGGGWPGSPNGVANSDAAGLYRRSRMGLNLYRREGETAEGVAAGPREVEMAACGLPFLRDPRDEGDELLPFLPVFHSPAEAMELLKAWLTDNKMRESTAARLPEAVKDRTFSTQAARILRFLEEEHA